MKKKQYIRGDVQCNCCGNYHYEWWMISPKKKLSKKIGCSSYMDFNIAEESYKIYCSYGSGYDGDSFDVIHQLISSRKHSLGIERLMLKSQTKTPVRICDKCMERFINKKYISPTYN